MPSYSVAGHFFFIKYLCLAYFFFQVFDFSKPLNLLITLSLSFRMKSNKDLLESNFSVVGK